MKYGHILGFIKLRWARSIVDGIEEPSDDLKWSEASSLMDEVYDKVARYDKTFALFDCPYCLSVRIAMILTLMTLPLMWYHLGYGLVFLFTMPLTYKLNDI